jgi:cation diffusion facilitator CzcD-associated flavoprotein CzcO
MTSTHSDVVVIGAGQAGLAVGYCLEQRRAEAVLLAAGA